MYGKELIVDLHECGLIADRRDLQRFFDELCVLINVEQCDLHFWDYDGDPEGYANAESHLRGTSAVQFIKTSNIVVHTVDDQKKVFINLFSCKDFDTGEALKYIANFFHGYVAHSRTVIRG